MYFYATVCERLTGRRVCGAVVFNASSEPSKRKLGRVSCSISIR